MPNICTDKILPWELTKPQRSVRRDGSLRAISPIGKTWPNGSQLSVQFIGGTTAQRNTAQEQAGWWSSVANLSFAFNGASNADIRISFDSRDGAWSYIGTDAKYIPLGKPTMNLGFLDGGTPAHEWGHAIGLGHEHSNPLGGIQWNEAAVISALAGPPNYWSESMVRHNVLEKYSVDQIHGTSFDPKSIMLYYFPASWTLNGVSGSYNQVLSDLDKAFVAGIKMYPKKAGDITDLLINKDPTEASISQAGAENLFRFHVDITGKHVIETHGQTDVVMKLYGPDNPTNLIASDDDSGLLTNARISIDLMAGGYLVQVRHYRKTKTGLYSISVRRP